MEYPRYLAAVEKFFENAELKLKRRGTDYPESPLNPSFLLIDEARKNYYLMEIFFPPTEPSIEESLLIRIKEYAQINSIDENACSAAVTIGKNISAGWGRMLDDTLPPDFIMKAAAVAPDEFAPVFTEYLKSAGIKFETVPVKGKFIIYFINNSSFVDLEKSYRGMLPPPQREESYDASEDDEDDTFESFNRGGNVEAEDASAVMQDSGEGGTYAETASEDRNTEGSGKEGVISEINNEAASDLDKAGSEPLPQDDSGTAEGANAERVATQEIITIDVGFNGNSRTVSDEYIPAFITDLEKFHKRTSRTFGFADAMRHIWSFFAFAPAYLISRLTRKRLPMFISFWIGGMCVALGAYYPLAYLFKPLEILVTAELYNAASSLNELYRLTGGLAEYIDLWCSNLFGIAFALSMVLTELIKFVNTVFYMQIFLSIGYFLAIVPAWREFGKRMIAFLIVFYVIFIPLTELAAIAGDRLAMHYIMSTAPIMGGLNLMGSIGCYILVMLSAPVLAAVLANRASASKADVL
jgi:hypothetical protein